MQTLSTLGFLAFFFALIGIRLIGRVREHARLKTWLRRLVWVGFIAGILAALANINRPVSGWGR